MCNSAKFFLQDLCNIFTLHVISTTKRLLQQFTADDDNLVIIVGTDFAVAVDAETGRFIRTE